ncbi:MAG: glycosyltransferase [Acidobacteriota bacterium]
MKRAMEEPEPRLESTDLLSVIVPVWNGAATIGRTIEALLGQTRPADEIIIVDDGSTDQTAQALARFGGQIRVVRRPNGGPAAARNSGIEVARGGLIAFTDSDCVPAADWLASLCAGFAGDPEGRIAGVGGVVRGDGETLTDQYIDLIQLLDPEPDAGGQIPYLITANACFRRQALVEVGGFDEGFRKPGGEEAELGHRLRRASYEFRFTPAAIVRHRHRQSPGALLRTLANYGEGAARIGRRWPELRIEDPGRLMLRQLISPRALLGRLRQRIASHGWRRGLYFALLDQLRHPSFLRGYYRGERLAAHQRHHSLL